MKSFVVARATTLFLLLLAGCGSSTTPAAGDAASSCAPLPMVAKAAVPVSFRNDVLPVFSFGCAFASCHGTARSDRVYLGTRAADGEPLATPSAIRAALLERSNEADLALVVPSRPEESFLMYKLDGDFCAIASRCVDDCGEPMPKDAALLAASERDTIRRWIAEGAADN